MNPNRTVTLIAAQALSLAVLAASAVAVTARESPVLSSSACVNQSSAQMILHQGNFAGPHLAGTEAVVRIDLARQGWVRSVSIAKSSGHPAFDAAAVGAAQTTAFAPAARGCVAIESRFNQAFHVAADGRVVATIETSETTALR